MAMTQAEPSEFEQKLDLQRLAKRLVTEDGLASLELTLSVIEEYKRFFLLCSLVDEDVAALVPSPMVDLVWQRHQLDTSNYFEDCSRFCFPDGYLHRHNISHDKDPLASSIEEKEADCHVQGTSIATCYRTTLSLYERMFKLKPHPVIWPIDAFDCDDTAFQVCGVAMPYAAITTTAHKDPELDAKTEATEDELVAELMWVGEVVRAELPKKQARCAAQGEPINQIRFYPHCDCFVPSAEEEQARLELVVREYVRFLKLAMKVHMAGDADDGDGDDDGTGAENSDPSAEEPGGISSETKRSAAYQVTPSKLVDELWHAHILRSPAYFQFCAQHAPGGQYVHHEPHFDKPHNYHEPGFNATLQAYVAQFGCPPKDVWGVLGESGGGCGGGGGGCGGGGGGCGGSGCGGGGGAGCGRCGYGGGGGCGGGGVFRGPRFRAEMGRSAGPLGCAVTVNGMAIEHSPGKPVMPANILGCGACSAVNGNEGRSYDEVKAVREGIFTREVDAERQRKAGMVLGRTHSHNEVRSVPGKSYVIARSCLRTFGFAKARFGAVHQHPRLGLALYPNSGAAEWPFLFEDRFVTKELYCHIQRQIYYAEVALYGAGNAIAALKKPDLLELKQIHGKSAKCREALYHELWERHGYGGQLTQAMDLLLAPFSVRLVKIAAEKASMKYDYYVLEATVQPWTPRLATPPELVVRDLMSQWESVKQEQLTRKAAIDKKWFKTKGEWEYTAKAAQLSWLQQAELTLAPHGMAPYVNVPSSRTRDMIQWDLRFVQKFDLKSLLEANVRGDRPYLHAPYLNLHPKIAVPAATQPSTPVTPALSLPTTSTTTAPPPPAYTAGLSAGNYAPPAAPLPMPSQMPVPMTPMMPMTPAAAPAGAPRTVQLSVTVPPGYVPGQALRFLTPLGKELQCIVPPGSFPGMQLMVNVQE